MMGAWGDGLDERAHGLRLWHRQPAPGKPGLQGGRSAHHGRLFSVRLHVLTAGRKRLRRGRELPPHSCVAAAPAPTARMGQPLRHAAW